MKRRNRRSPSTIMTFVLGGLVVWLSIALAGFGSAKPAQAQSPTGIAKSPDPESGERQCGSLSTSHS